MNPNLILYRQLHQPQIDQDLETRAFTAPKIDTHLSPLEVNKNPLTPAHLLCSPVRMPTLISPLTALSQQEGNECNTNEKDNKTRISVDFKSTQSDIESFESRDSVSLWDRCYNLKDRSVFTKQPRNENDNRNIEIDENVNESDVSKSKKTSNMKEQQNILVPTPSTGMTKSEI